MAVRTFKHSGDAGDIIFSLPAIRALGGGILYLDPEGGQIEPLVKYPNANKTRTKLNPELVASLRTLLVQQEYVADVRDWVGETVDYNLDEFRRHVEGNNNLCDAYFRAFGLQPTQKDAAWLRVDQPLVEAGFPIVISRSVRYHGNFNFWEQTLPRIAGQCLFVGLPKEHEIFEYTFGYRVRYFPTATILDLARVIAGSKQFYSNQGLPHAIAEGLKKDLIQEFYRVAPTALFARPGALYV